MEDSIDAVYVQENLDTQLCLHADTSESHDSQFSLQCNADDGGSSSSVQSFFKEETSPITTCCFHCGNYGVCKCHLS